MSLFLSNCDISNRLQVILAYYNFVLCLAQNGALHCIEIFTFFCSQESLQALGIKYRRFLITITIHNIKTETKIDYSMIQKLRRLVLDACLKPTNRKYMCSKCHSIGDPPLKVHAPLAPQNLLSGTPRIESCNLVPRRRVECSEPSDHAQF